MMKNVEKSGFERAMCRDRSAKQKKKATQVKQHVKIQDENRQEKTTNKVKTMNINR
jgi:hypothetical protein